MSDEKQQKDACLLKLQIGPVQDFIAQARSTRDLWSGSYLISWLMAAGISRLVRELASATNRQLSDCLDAVVYPDLQGQPLVERRLGVDNDQPSDQKADNNAVLTPNLPNILVAILEVSQSAAKNIAEDVEQALRNEWKAIAKGCWEKAQQADVLILADKTRFDAQIDRFLTVTWQVTPFDPEQYARD
jgi:CRISPR-associated protein Cmr2